MVVTWNTLTILLASPVTCEKKASDFQGQSHLVFFSNHRARTIPCRVPMSRRTLAMGTIAIDLHSGVVGPLEMLLMT
jgi:hypothetical protein